MFSCQGGCPYEAIENKRKCPVLKENIKEYLEKTYENALYIAKKYDWKEVFCVEEGQLRTIEDINDEIMSVIFNDVLHRKYKKK